MNKKIYKIGDKIEVDEILSVANGIVKKAVNVIATSGDRIALELQENKHIDLKQDLVQEVATQLILNNYIISKECYKIVRSYIYKKNRDTIELIIDEDGTDEGNDFKKMYDKIAYVKYINEYKEVKNSKQFNINKLMDGLTERQKEIIYMYAKCNSMQKVADLLGIKKSSVSDAIYTIRNKISKMQYEIA